MTAENWTIIKGILQEVLELAPPERGRFLQNPDLSDEVRAEVKSLLEFEETSEDFMSATAGNLTGELVFGKEKHKNSLFGQKIGIYEITGELGFGGMGAVYLAERKDKKFEQKFAKDMVYLIWCGGVGEKDRATYLMEAINMMRETNPNNLNLPYMLADYTSRLMMPDISEKH